MIIIPEESSQPAVLRLGYGPELESESESESQSESKYLNISLALTNLTTFAPSGRTSRPGRRGYQSCQSALPKARCR